MKITLEFLEALSRKDFKSAGNYLSENVSYMAPLNSFNGAEPYFKYIGLLIFTILDIKKVLAEGSHDVCIFWEVSYGALTIFVSAW